MVLLVITLLLEFFIAFISSKGDFFRPSVLVSGLMFTAAIFALYLSFIWNFEVNLEAASLIIISMLVFIIVDYFVPHGHLHISSSEFKPIKVNNGMIIAIIIFEVVVIYFHIQYLKSNFENYGTLWNMAQMYRNYIVWGSTFTQISGNLSRAIRIMQNFSFILLYVGIYNVIAGEKNKSNIFSFIPVCIYAADTLLMGARGYIMYIIFSGLTYLYVLYQRKHDWKQKYSFKVLKKICILMVIVTFAFAWLGGSLGRDNSNGAIYSIAKYFGGPIALFNDYIEKGGDTSPDFGALTFNAFYSFMSRRFGWTDYSDINQFEFRTYNGRNWGNVYTALRRYHQDFGYFGTIIMVLILAMVFCILYRKVKYAKNDFWGSFVLIYYGIISRAIFLFFFDDEFFNDFCTPSILMYLFGFAICLMLVYKPIKVKNGKITISGRAL